MILFTKIYFIFIKFTKKNILGILLIIFLPFNISSIKSSEMPNIIIERENQSTTFVEDDFTIADEYILGPGDNINLFFTNTGGLYNGLYTVGIGGNIILPENITINAVGLTLEDLKNEIETKFQKFIKDPTVFLNIILYRPIKVYVLGEVNRPGIYTVSLPQRGSPNNIEYNLDSTVIENPNLSPNYSDTLFPTVYDAIKAAKGITTNSDLSAIETIRKTPKKYGNQKIMTTLNFLDLFLEGDQEQNIILRDGDTIKVKKTSNPIPKQLTLAAKSNINPNTVMVFVTGNVVSSGSQLLPQGSSLNQAIAMAGGQKIFSRGIELMRFNNDQSYERRSISFKPNSKVNAFNNPTLVSGDIIHVKKSPLGVGSEALREIGGPIFGFYGLINLFD